MTPPPPPRVHPTLRGSPSTSPPVSGTTRPTHSPSLHTLLPTPPPLHQTSPFPFPGGRTCEAADRDAPSALPRHPPLPPRHAPARRRGYVPST
ncbi:hypothetical protein PVAP13_6KG080335, partial [Panicum virgatum]